MRAVGREVEPMHLDELRLVLHFLDASKRRARRNHVDDLTGPRRHPARPARALPIVEIRSSEKTAG